MFPIALDLSTVSIALAGRGDSLLRRLDQLLVLGAAHITVFCDSAEDSLLHLAGDQLVQRLPREDELVGHRLLLVTGLPEANAIALAITARSLGLLVNVEDMKEYCDFYCMSLVNRGVLQIGITTGGASPALASGLREFLEVSFGPEWAEHAALVEEKRGAWRREGKSPAQIRHLTHKFIQEQGWLPNLRADAKEELV